VKFVHKNAFLVRKYFWHSVQNQNITSKSQSSIT